MTKKEAIEGALRWIDEATVGGSVLDSDETADFRERMAVLLDSVLHELAGRFRLFGQMTVVQSPVPVRAGTWESRMVLPGDVFRMEADGAKSFYFEICGSAAVTIAADSGEISAVSCNCTEKFFAYRGNLPGAEGKIVLEASGSAPFVIRNIALYGTAFGGEAEVPAYTAWRAYTMPENFRELDEIVRVTNGVRQVFGEFQKQGGKCFLLPYAAEGEFCFCFFRNPTPLAANAAADTVLDCATGAECLIPLRLAIDATVGMEEKAGLSAYLENRFDTMQWELLPAETGKTVSVEAKYGVMAL